MILIVDNTRRKIRKELKDLFFKNCVPCHIVHSDKMTFFMPTHYVMPTEEYLIRDIKYCSDMFSEQEVVEYDESVPLITYCTEILNNTFLCKYKNYRCKNIRIIDGKIWFCGKNIRLTKTERRIFNMMLYSNEYYSADIIGAFCLSENARNHEGTIKVHIHNINKKALYLTGHKLIAHRNYKGYKFNRF